MDDLFAGLPAGSRWLRTRRNYQKLFSLLPELPGVIFEHTDRAITCDVSCRLDADDGSLVYFLDCVASTARLKDFRRLRLCNFLQNNRHRIDTAWLEFDDADIDQVLPQPSLFFRPLPGIHWLTFKEDLQRLSQGTLNESVFPLVDQWIDILPDTELHYLGIMLPRRMQGLRLCLQMSWKQLLSVIDKKGLPLDKNHLARPANPERKVVLSVDMHEVIHSRIGIEFPLLADDDPYSAYHIPSGNFFDCIENRAWERSSSNLSHRLATATDGVSFLKVGHGERVYTRRINHIKQVFTQPGRPPELKTYFYLGQGRVG